ncbi:hypothetical protein WKR88_13770 [Trinickia caryophylli]|nr:hypothetical protein [Trinickia caryophylli]PMS10319.1 hypothetical protein C0Z17_20735 [Trinickia caryophylli]TRX18720.1 hypothetical protein FNF07_11155 [Trinickia caryophylli]WQE10484.1 hypothetical protein U0034_11770 [Trinickia caryophylli]
MTLTAVALTACSPEYDWRTVTDTSQGYTIDMPAKPTQDERQIALAGTAMPMHVRAAHLAHSVFAVGVVDLPSDDPRLQREVLDTLRSALGRHLGAPGEARPARVPLAAGGDASAVDVAVTGVAGSAHEHKVIHAWLVARGRRVYQAVIIADEAPPAEQTDQFFRSFKLF